MSLLAELGAAVRELPASVRSGLRPGVAPNDSPARRMRRNFVYHLHPLKVTVRALQASSTFGLGVISLTLFAVLTLTGLLLMLYYVPTPAGAYASMLDIENVVSFGELTRLIHRWAAHGMVITVALHLVRVWAMASYRKRELNWVLGLGLFSMVLALAFTGYLLPWDQTSYWAVRVVTNMLDHVPLLGAGIKRLMLGGSEIGSATLVRFYALHVALVPIPLLLLAALHLWRIRRDGGLARPAGVEADTVPAWPHLVAREGAVMLAVIAAVVVVALLLDSPLGPPADALRPENPEKAPWYFLGVQEMVSYSAVVGGFIFPIVLASLLLVLPFVDHRDQGVGHYLAEDRGNVVGMAAAGAVVAALAVTMAVSGQLSALDPVLQDLVNPATIVLVYAFVAFWVVGGRTASLRSALRVALVILAVGLVVFTVVGFCRGPDWTFYWPWQEWPGGV